MSDRRRRENPPPVRCSAKARRTGGPCKRWAVPGRVRCRLHGGYAGPHKGRPAAEERAGAALTLAQAMASNPGRPVWEVILDSIRTVDVLAQAARDEVAAGRVTSAEGIERVASLARSAHAMASSVMATKALEAYTAHTERWSDAVATRLAMLLTDWLGLPTAPTGHVAAALGATLGQFDPNAPDRTPRPDGPSLLDQVGRALGAALAPRLGVPARDLAGWHRQVVDAVDAGLPAPDLPVTALAALPAAPEPEPVSPVATEPAPEPAQPEPLTLNRQSAVTPEPEPEVVDGELVEAAPARRSGRVTTTLGTGPTVITFPSSYRDFH